MTEELIYNTIFIYLVIIKRIMKNSNQNYIHWKLQKSNTGNILQTALFLYSSYININDKWYSRTF